MMMKKMNDDIDDDEDDGAMTEWYSPSEIPIRQMMDLVFLT